MKDLALQKTLLTMIYLKDKEEYGLNIFHFSEKPAHFR